MKCIRCGKDCKYPERLNGKCPHCRGKFAFEPRKGALLNDVAFKAAIDAVSAKGRMRWGVEHLYYEVCRRCQGKQAPLGCFALALIATLGVIGVLVMNANGMRAWPLLAIAVVFLMFILIRSFRKWQKTVCISVENFNDMWRRWQDVHGTPKGLIERKEQPPKPKAQEPDIGDYSFDRAVICDRARTVDLLLANNFHFENNCAVVSVEGYPPGPFETVREMLRRNPKLEVFALHDATPDGCRLAKRLMSDPAWFQGGVPVIDVGLKPRHAKPLKGLWLKARTPLGEPIETLSGNENDWLSNYWLELAAIRPEQLLKRLFRAITHQPAATDADGGVVIADGGSFSSDAGDSDAGADSFG